MVIQHKVVNALRRGCDRTDTVKSNVHYFVVSGRRGKMANASVVFAYAIACC